MSTSADLGIVYIAGQQAQPEITHNTALNQIQILQTGVVSVGNNTPPGSPAQGDSYILGATPTGAWAGRAHCLAGYFGTGWVFVPGVDSSGTQITMGVRHEGLSVWSKADNAFYVWSGTAWGAASGGMTNPMTTSGDVIYGGASGTPTRLGVGSNGQVLTLAGGVPSWAAGGTQKGIASAIASGDYYLNQSIDTANTVIQITNNISTTVFCPLFLDAQLTVDALALYLPFAEAAKVFDITVYEFLGCGKPGVSLASVQGSAAVTGMIPVTLTPVVLPAGVYFIALHTNATAAYCTSAQGDQAGGDMASMLMLSDGYAKTAGTQEGSNYSVNDSALPGGAYTRGMNLTGFTINAANATYNTMARRVFLRKA